MRRTSSIIVIGAFAFASLASYTAYRWLVRRPAESIGLIARRTTPVVTPRSAGQPPEATGENTQRNVASLASAQEMQLDRPTLRHRGAGSHHPSPAEATVYEKAFRDRLDAVDAAFRSEAMDPNWSTKLTAMLRADFRKNKAFRNVRSIECRSRTCRIEIPEDGRGTITNNLPVLTLRFAATLPAMQVDRAKGGNGGKDTLILYMSRITSPAS